MPHYVGFVGLALTSRAPITSRWPSVQTADPEHTVNPTAQRRAARAKRVPTSPRPAAPNAPTAKQAHTRPRQRRIAPLVMILPARPQAAAPKTACAMQDTLVTASLIATNVTVIGVKLVPARLDTMATPGSTAVAPNALLTPRRPREALLVTSAFAKPGTTVWKSSITELTRTRTRAMPAQPTQSLGKEARQTMIVPASQVNAM